MNLCINNKLVLRNLDMLRDACWPPRKEVKFWYLKFFVLSRRMDTNDWCSFLKKWAIPGLFFFIVVFSIQLTENKCSI